MTLPDHDPKRNYKKPVAEVADALRASFKATVSAAAEEPFEKTGVAVPADAVWSRYATAAIARLRELGMINLDGLAAIRAEEGEGK